MQLRYVVCVVFLLALLPACGQPAPQPATRWLGINLNGPADWNTELPFVDLFRLSRRWISQRQGAGWGQGPELARDANGWVTRLEAGCWADTPMCTNANGHVPKGDYVVLYEGKGRIEFMNAQVTKQEPGRIVFTLPANTNGFFLRLRETDPADYIRNIRVLQPGCEDTYRKEPFRADFLKRWGEFNTIRFMDWMRTNHADNPKEWADRPTPTYCNFTERGVPVEVMVDLCNRLRANPWFCMPHAASDDYIRKFAAAVKAGLDPALKVHIEYSNEVWNSIFPSNRYAQEQGKALHLGAPERPWEGGGMYYAHRSLEIFRIWEATFGSTERLVRVLAWQAVSPWWSERIILPTEDAFKHVDVLAIAPYINPRFGASGQPSGDEAAAWTVEQLLDYTEQKALPVALKAMADQKAVADKFGLTLMCYEAGEDMVGVGPAQNNEKLTALLLAANRSPRMGAMFTKYLDAWRAVGGDTMCVFTSFGRWSKYGSCNLAEYFDATEADSPKYAAVMAWNRAHARR
jgi:hypothetical protein